MERKAIFLLLLTVSLAVACSAGCQPGTGATTSSGSKTSATSDSVLAAWPKAEAAVKRDAPDAILLFVGTGGLALADVPDNWGFTFYSPAKNSMYKVSVEGDTVEGPSATAVSNEAMKSVTQAVDINTIKVGGAKAVVDARAFAEKSGTVPKNVMVMGTFATVPQTTVKTDPGVWYVTFASGTDLADAQAYSVNMQTGEVAKVEK